MKNKKTLLIGIGIAVAAVILALVFWGMNSKKVASPEQQKDPKPKVKTTCSFEVAEGEYEAPLTVVIQKVKDDDKIYYTTDGSDPTEASKLYEEPFVLEAGEYLVKAVTYNAKGERGKVEEMKYTVIQTQDPETILLNNLQGKWYSAQYDANDVLIYETDIIFTNEYFDLIDRGTVSGDAVRVYYRIASVNDSGTQGFLEFLDQESSGIIIEEEGLTVDCGESGDGKIMINDVEYVYTNGETPMDVYKASLGY